MILCRPWTPFLVMCDAIVGIRYLDKKNLILLTGLAGTAIALVPPFHQ